MQLKHNDDPIASLRLFPGIGAESTRRFRVILDDIHAAHQLLALLVQQRVMCKLIMSNIS